MMIPPGNPKTQLGDVTTYARDTGLKPYDISRVSILVCEPNKHMQLLLKQIFNSFYVRDVRFADDPAVALQMLKTFHPDLIVTELRMEPLDGFEFVKMLRTSSDASDPFVSVIMLTGHSDARNVYTARDSGVTEFLAKPVTPKALYNRIVSIIEHPRAFIRTKVYYGPDRRRMSRPGWEDCDRRASSKVASTHADPFAR